MSKLLACLTLVCGVALAAAPAEAQAADQLYQQAQGYYAEYTWDKAISLFDQFVKQYPQDPRATEAEFKALYATFKLQRYDQLEQRLTDFVAKHPNTLWAARAKKVQADFLYQYRRWDNWDRIAKLYTEALADYRNAIGRRPLGTDEKRELIGWMFDAAAFYQSWWYNEAPAKAKELLESIIEYRLDANTTAKAWLQLGLLYRGRLQGVQKDALDQAEKAWLTVYREFATTDSADEALWNLAQLSLQRENFIEARNRLLELRRRYPKSTYEDQARQQIAEIEAPVVNLGVSRTHLPGAKIPTAINVRNLQGVTFTAWKIDLFKAFEAGLMPQQTEDLLKYAQQVGRWHQAVQDKRDYKYQQFKLDTPLRKAGLYLIRAEADGQPKVRDESVVNITSLVLVQNSAQRKLVSYIASRDNREPVSGVELRVARQVERNNNNARLKEIARGTTDGDGLLTSAIPVRGENDGWDLTTVGRRGEELVFQGGLYTWWNEPEASLDAYVYTDRPVYRPSNTVHYRAILRRELNGQFTNLPNRDVQVTVRDPRGQELQKVKLTSDAYGTVNGELTLGAAPTLGVYGIQLEVEGQNSGGSFRVEEYRKPEFEVTVGRPLAEVRPGGAAAVPVTATYYFGAPVAGAEVKYVVQRRPYYHYAWWPMPWDWFYAGWHRRYERNYGGSVVKEGTAKTDAKGQAIIEFPTTDDTEDYTYTIQAQVVDVTRRVIDASGSLTVTHKGFFLSARAGQGLYQPDQNVTVTVKAENADSQPVTTDLALTLYKMKWVDEKVDEKTKQKVAAHYERDAAVWPQPMTARTDPATGKRDFTFKAPKEGYYEAEASAPDTFDPKAKVLGTAQFWVASDAMKGVNYNHADLQLITEQDLYQKGETVRMLVNSPVPSGAVLLTIGADAIYKTQVIRFTQNSFVLHIPVQDNYAPNVFIKATVVGAKQVYFAEKTLMVPPTDKLLKIQVASDQAEYKPRTKGTFTITTTGANGEPVPAQVSLGIADESVYAIADEMVEPIGSHFWARQRGDNIRSAVSFEGYGEYDESAAADRELASNAQYARRGAPTAAMPAPAPGAPGAPGAGAPKAPPMVGAAVRAEAAMDKAGGGAGGGEAPVTVREFFPDTILWQPTITTGQDGKATVTVDFPDSLTTWRATARAITQDTHVGQQVEKVVTTKDLIVRLQAPRFFTQLDQTTISLVVTNKTDRQQQVALSVDVDGLQFVGDPKASCVIPPRGQARVDRQVNAVESGKATITVVARGADDSDAVKQTFDVIPHGAMKFDAAAGHVGDTGTAQAILKLPEARRDDATKLSVTVSPTLVASLLDALPYLVQYPYGCVEQTTSKFLPAVMVARTLDYTGKPAAGGKPKQVPDWWQSRGLDALPDMVRVGIKKLTSMQNSDGGFGWFGGMRSDVWMSAYVTYGLAQARLADFAVPDDALTRAQAFLANNLQLLAKELDSTAYVAWVLSDLQAQKLGRLNGAQTKALEDAFQRVYANRDELNDYTRALLILGLVNRGEADKAQVVWRNLQARRIETEHGVHWGQDRWGWRWSQDQVETTAFSLLAALAVEPNSELATKAVQWLELNRTGNHWYSTKDTAAAIFAMAKFADQRKELNSTYSVQLSVNGKPVKTWNVTPQNALTLDGKVQVDKALLHSGENRIDLARSGAGSLYYSALLEFYTREDPITAASSYLSATRRYFAVTDYTDAADNNARKTRRVEVKPGDVIPSGQELEVEITVNAENDFDYICLADPKPAGCEPVDKTSGGTWGGTWLYRELKDKEVTFFADHLSQGKTTLTYRLRAETPGTFRALPHTGFSMYRPDVRCLSDEAIVKIGERPAAAE